MTRPIIYGIAGVFVLLVGAAAVWQFHTHGGALSIVPQPKTMTIDGETYETMASFPHDAELQLTGTPDRNLIYSFNSDSEEFSFSTVALTKADPNDCGPDAAVLGSFKVYEDVELGEPQDFGETQPQLDSFVQSGTAKKLNGSYIALSGASTYACYNNSKTKPLLLQTERQNLVQNLLKLVKSGS
jgi:hypothetical protein